MKSKKRETSLKLESSTQDLVIKRSHYLLLYLGYLQIVKILRKSKETSEKKMSVYTQEQSISC